MSLIEDEVCRKIQERAGFGLQKYGVSLERTDLNTLDWLIHAQEEAMDLAGYLQVLINREKIQSKLSTELKNEIKYLLLESTTTKKSPEMVWKLPSEDHRLDYGS